VARFLGGVDPRVAPRARKRSKPSRKKEALPLEAVEAELHDEFAEDRAPVSFRPVTIINASEKKQLQLRIEVPVEDMARIAGPVDVPSGPAGQGPTRASIWSSIHPRLLELIRAHQSTLLFVNSRGSPNVLPVRSTSSPANRSCDRTTDRWHAPRAARSKTC
jgi:ATP-dependent Lhr-like helicase